MSAQLPGRGNRAGMVLATLLVLLRLALPGLPLSVGGGGQDAALAGILGDTPICHAGAADPSNGHEPADTPNMPMHDCALCPVCQLAAPMLLPEAVWVTAPRLVGNARIALLPPATAPPSHDRYAARPRGPPAFLV